MQYISRLATTASLWLGIYNQYRAGPTDGVDAPWRSGSYIMAGTVDSHRHAERTFAEWTYWDSVDPELITGLDNPCVYIKLSVGKWKVRSCVDNAYITCESSSELISHSLIEMGVMLLSVNNDSSKHLPIILITFPLEDTHKSVFIIV